MAVPLTKRRKLSHSPSEEEDNASFESFGESDDVADNVAVSEDDVMGDDDEELDEGLDEREDAGKITKSPAQQAKASEKVKPGQKQNVADANNAASMALTGGTFKSNMFKLQIDELLAEVQLKHGKREVVAEEALHKLKSLIENLPSREPLSIADAERELVKKSRVAIPFPEPRPAHDAQYKLEFQKPSNVNVVGSYALKLSSRTNPVLTIDMTVTMPASILQEKDFLNHRYFYKRAFYLACVAAGLLKHVGKDMNVRFANFHDNPLKPIIEVSPKTETAASKAWQINIIPALPAKAFGSDKLLPTKNAVRSTKTDGTQESVAATPFYNSSIQADSQITAYLKLVHSASTKAEAFRDACLLGRVWLRQRALSSDISGGGFGNFEFTALVALLLHSGGVTGAPALSPGYSSYQLFKATLQYISTKDLVKQPVVIEAPGLQFDSLCSCPLLFDGSRSHNLLYKMTSWSYRSLRSQARTTLSMLGDTQSDQFENTFILREDIVHQKYDLALVLPYGVLSATTSEDQNVQDSHIKLYSVLSRGLGDRISHIHIKPSKPVAWDLGSARPLKKAKGDTVISFTINPANASRTVDHGPPAEKKKEAAEFRKFWGEKAELRRFKDGSILESLVWSSEDCGQSILHQIIVYLLQRHFGDSAAASVTFTGDAFARLLRQNNGITPFQPLMDAFKTLEDDIRAMQDLPLAIRQIAAADSQLRYASVEAPFDSNGKRMKRPADVVVQFESSGKWPDDLVAIQRTKIAFLLKIAELFANTNPDITARVGLENTTTEVLNQGFLDIVYPDGASFRLRIHHDREQTLIERVLKDKTASPQTRESAAQGLAAYKRHFIRTPAHTLVVQKLCTRYPALSPTLRLVKKWFAAHLLTSHFHPVLIELLTLRTFTNPYPYAPPSSAKTGLLRTLSFLSRWDWRFEPLIVDLNSSLTPTAVAALRTRFEAWRKLDPSLNRIVLFAASSLDGDDGTTFTDSAPSKVVAGRMTALARACVAEVQSKDISLDANVLFTSPLSDYDFVLHLNPIFCGAKPKSSESKFKNLVVATDGPENVGLNIVAAYVDELKALYGDHIVLFYGEGSRVVGCLWSPLVSAQRAWKVGLGYSTRPLEGGVVEVNREGIVAEMSRLGGDLVSKVEING